MDVGLQLLYARKKFGKPALNAVAFVYDYYVNNSDLSRRVDFFQMVCGLLVLHCEGLTCKSLIRC